MRIEIEVKIDDSTIKSLLVDAFSGAAQNWCCDAKVWRFPKDKTYSDYEYWTAGVPMDPGGVLKFTDPEGDPDWDSAGKDGYYTLSLSKIKRGIKRLAYDSGRPRSEGGIPYRHWENIVKGTHDWETADVFLQYCVLGEIVYG
jgi:hypothetical protein